MDLEYAYECPNCDEGIIIFDEYNGEWACDTCDWHKEDE